MKNTEENLHKGHRQRLFKKFYSNYGRDLENYELIEVLLCLKIPRGNVNPTAHRLINKFGSISNILEASIEDLMTVEGIGKQTAIFLSMLPKFLKFYLESKNACTRKLSNSLETENYIRSKFVELHTEGVLAIVLSSSNKIIASSMLFTGDHITVDLDLTKLHKFVFSHEGVASVIIAHNHLEDCCDPSNADLYATEKVYSSLKMINVSLLDHIIISKTKIFSFFEEGLIDEIKNKYTINEFNFNSHNSISYSKKNKTNNK